MQDTDTAPEHLRPHIKKIFVPTDFSEGAYHAFLHALRIAIATNARLTLLHVKTANDAGQRSDFPQVRETLEAWGVLPEGGQGGDAWNRDFMVRKAIAEGGKPITACVEEIEEENPDLIVLATHQEGGRHHWFGHREHDHLAEPLADAAGEMTLFVPYDTPGFVDEKSGEITLRNILVPVALEPRPQRAVDSAARIAHRLGDGNLQIHLLHVGPADEMPALNIPENDEAQWDATATQGKVDEAILRKAAECQGDLIVMTTDGHHGFLDALRGTTTERVMRGAHCPLLAIPMGA